MAGVLHPREQFVEDFLKSAAKALPKPYGMGDVAKATNRTVPTGPQLYSQPNPSQQVTRPDLVSSQKATPPPPVRT